MAGVLLAYLRHHRPRIWLSLCRVAPALALAGLAVYLFVYVARYNPEWGFRDPDKLLLALMFASWVLLANSSESWQSSLYLPGAHYIATRSYAMYLLHVEPLALLRRFSDEMSFPVYFLLTLAATIVFSEVLFRLVEAPFMRLRERFPQTRSSSSIVGLSNRAS